MHLVCDQFHCLPSEAIRELQSDAHNLMLKVLEIRGFEEAWRALEQARRGKAEEKDYPTGYWVDWVYRAVKASLGK